LVFIGFPRSTAQVMKSQQERNILQKLIVGGASSQGGDYSMLTPIPKTYKNEPSNACGCWVITWLHECGGVSRSADVLRVVTLDDR
jgi:hypothetical protein